VETRARWFGPEERPLLGWVSATPAARASGVVVAPPVGYPYVTSHRALRLLADGLASDGHVVLRFDYDGTGDSAGDARDGDRVAAWRASLRAAAAELRSLGCTRLTIVGVRLGGTFALLDGAELGADAVVAWLPVTSGRRYAKELRLLATEIPGDAAHAVAGDVWTETTLAELGALAVDPDAPLPPRTLVVGEPFGDADVLPPAGSEGILETSAERAVTPVALLDAIRSWIGPAAGAPLDVPAGSVEATLDGVRETVLRLGPHRLAAIASEPPRGAGGATLLLLNSGSEPHVGPGRAWVAFARELARRGHRAVRADFRAWGESPADGLAPVPYAEHCRDDVLELVRALEELGHRNVVPFGLCSSAYVALRAAAEQRLAGVVALNPQLYWAPPQPVELTPEENRRYRTPVRDRYDRWARFGVWSALDALGLRSPAGRWLDALRRRGTPVTLVFAAGDEGLHHLRVRLGRRFAAALRNRSVRLVEIPDIDHSMHRVWLRGAVVDALDEALSEVAAPAPEPLEVVV
jgi:alpha-beta hydrolase superfamily lysophospholipase